MPEGVCKPFGIIPALGITTVRMNDTRMNVVGVEQQCNLADSNGATSSPEICPLAVWVFSEPFLHLGRCQLLSMLRNQIAERRQQSFAFTRLLPLSGKFDCGLPRQFRPLLPGEVCDCLEQ